MPTDTYFNLPEEKQGRIMNAAFDEFSSRPFHRARVTAIADKAGISKGSFYQYFSDKKDMFKYIIARVADKKLEYIDRDMMANKDKHSFFELLREAYMSGIRFARENPRLLEIGDFLLADKKLQQEIWGDQEDKSIDFYKHLLEEGVKSGEIDGSININLTAKLLMGLNYSLADIIYEEEINYGSLKENIGVIDEMLNFIENGLKKRD